MSAGCYAFMPQVNESWHGKWLKVMLGSIINVRWVAKWTNGGERHGHLYLKRTMDKSIPPDSEMGDGEADGQQDSICIL